MPDNIPDVIPRLEYERINWEDAPSRATPLSADNLNQMDNALAALYADVAIIWDKVKNIDQEAIAQAVASITNKADLESPEFTGTPTIDVDPLDNESASPIVTVDYAENNLRSLWVDMGTISSLPVQKNDAAITDDMICTAYEIGTPLAQSGNWTVETSDGYVTVDGTINGTTILKIKLEKVLNK